MEEFSSNLEDFVENISKAKRSYMEGNSDRKFVRESYIKWRQLKNIADISGVPDQKIEEMDNLMETAFEESFRERPRRDEIAESLKEFTRIFRKEVIVERKIAGKSTELDWEDPVSHFETYGITKEFEESIRAFIEDRLREKYGEDWFTEGVPKGEREEWKKRKQIDIQEAKETSDKIDYASFSDYFEIIKYSWDVFEEYFGDKDKTRVRFQDLQTLIRNPSAHVRKIDPDEVGHAKYTKKWVENKISGDGDEQGSL